MQLKWVRKIKLWNTAKSMANNQDATPLQTMLNLPAYTLKKLKRMDANKQQNLDKAYGIMSRW